MECAVIHYDKPHYFPMHLHPDRYTFSYIVDGSANLITNETVFNLQKGDLVIIPPFVAHQTSIGSFFHYKVIRVPRLHTFVDSKRDRIAVTIVRNSYYQLEFDSWFDSIKNSGDQNQKIPAFFAQFMVSNGSKLSTLQINLEKAIVHLDHNFHRKIAVEELSDITHFSESHFQRVFKTNIGISPTRYLQNLRIEKAKELIKTKDTLTSVAYDTGFFDQSHFNKYFKMNVGMIPQRYADIIKK